MAHSPQTEDPKFLAALAMAMVERPRASLQELARTIGVSKATLYRFCHTREELIERLMTHGIEVFSQAIDAAGLDDAPPLEALQRLGQFSFEHREINAFMLYYWKPESPMEVQLQAESRWSSALDRFFLRGQQTGVFRVDVTAATLTEMWVALQVGLVDAERRGRVARSGLAHILDSMFIDGARVR
ncbi:MAG: TetR/AcrR family transcriptional regulator [Bordetella sp.]|nr:TetR/AcrR family transcriptional regulator [Bordetella sp.]